MQRRNSKSLKKGQRKSSPVKKNTCSLCKIKIITTLNIQNSLYRKYSSSQNLNYLETFHEVIKKAEVLRQIIATENQEFLDKYYKVVSRKIIFLKMKEMYKLHHDIPRIFHPLIKEILIKSYHRKRLLDYFKIAKTFGLKIESINFSSFLLSLGQSHQNYSKSFKKIIGEISSYQFSTDIERQFLTQLKGKNVVILSENPQRHCNFMKKQ